MAIHTRALIPHRTRILIHQMRDIQEDIPRKPRQCPQRPTPPLLDRVSITTAPILVRLGKIGRRSLKLKENVSYLIWNLQESRIVNVTVKALKIDLNIGVANSYLR